MPSELPPLGYRTRDAANALGISERHLRELVARGAIRPCKVGRCTVFTLDELQRFLVACMKPAVSPSPIPSR
jgi:excisionase family DNA binding protein